jgi:hypothetical protein
MIDPQRIAELARDFGGGFLAYWTHHVFARVWPRMMRRRPPHH